MKKVKDNLSLLRDENNNAIVNTNHSEYQNYINLKRNNKNKNKKIEDIENEMVEMKNSIDEIKSMLSSLMNNIKW